MPRVINNKMIQDAVVCCFLALFSNLSLVVIMKT